MYATQADIEAIYGSDFLATIADRDGDGGADAEVVERGLQSAAAEIDSYIGVRHALPLPSVPAILKQRCVDIAVFLISFEATSATEDQRKRYEDALAWLVRVSKGDASLGLPSTSAEGGPRPVVIEGSPRLFTRNTMRSV